MIALRLLTAISLTALGFYSTVAATDQKLVWDVKLLNYSEAESLAKSNEKYFFDRLDCCNYPDPKSNHGAINKPRISYEENSAWFVSFKVNNFMWMKYREKCLSIFLKTKLCSDQKIETVYRRHIQKWDRPAFIGGGSTKVFLEGWVDEFERGHHVAVGYSTRPMSIKIGKDEFVEYLSGPFPAKPESFVLMTRYGGNFSVYSGEH